jgi:GNAT superfamily N-acetyltransferase
MGSYIRYANKEDVDALASIYSKTFQQAFRGIIPDDFLKEKFSYERLKDSLYKRLKEGIATCCIIFKDDIPVGMQTFIKDSSKEQDDSEIELGTICVLPEYWRQNIGGEFINWSLKEYKRKGYIKVNLWVVEENTRARKFYEKVGFNHDGEIRIINPGREIKEYRYIKHL